jgi:hypothetical protein
MAASLEDDLCEWCVDPLDDALDDELDDALEICDCPELAESPPGCEILPDESVISVLDD